MGASIEMFYSKINSVFTKFKLLLQIVLTYPITSNEAERSFSKLKLLLAPNRSTMSVIRINNLALMGYIGIVWNCQTLTLKAMKAAFICYFFH